MADLWFSPLAPTVTFLVGAFIVGLSSRKSYLSLGLSLLVLIILISRIGSSLNVSLVNFSDWGTGEVLTLRVDALSMAFLFIPVLLLIALFWARQTSEHGMLLALAGATTSVFVAANGISFSYALLFFDVLGCIYWLRQDKPGLALSRLFLAVLTTSVLMLTGLNQEPGLADQILAFVLWLRVGLFPFVELSYLSEAQRRADTIMIWLALSTAVGVYVAARFLAVPLPPLVVGLMVLIMILNAWLAWLDDLERIHAKLLRMTLIQPSLALLIAPIVAEVSITLGLAYTLGLGALWLTPQIGRPNFLERHWIWIYTAPILATLSLMGFPATFGWLAASWVYADLFVNSQFITIAIVMLAEGIAMSVLFQYWVWLLRNRRSKGEALLAALILAVPFLVPWVGGLTFSVVTGLDLSLRNTESLASNTGLVMVITWLLALGFGYGQIAILNWLQLTPRLIAPILDLTWLWPYAGRGADQISRIILRLRSVLEGAHYLGWAFLMSLAGILVVILS